MFKTNAAVGEGLKVLTAGLASDELFVTPVTTPVKDDSDESIL